MLQKTMVGAYLKRYPLVLMLEPLFRCNLACSGCGKIDYPDEILNQRLSVAECLEAVDECGAPVVAIAGGEPLLHKEMPRSSKGIMARARSSSISAPTRCCWKRRSISTSRTRISPGTVHLDGDKEMHDIAVCQEGVYDRAVAAIKEGQGRGFRVHQLHAVRRRRPGAVAKFFDDVMAMGIDGIMTSPGYAYERAPDQEHFLNRTKTKKLFRDIFRRGKGKGWKLGQSRCSWTSWPATRPTTARPGATRRATCSAGSGPAICSAKAMPRPSRS
jgi:hopanoid biosynthesis associated radical SAM protein HpnH